MRSQTLLLILILSLSSKVECFSFFDEKEESVTKSSNESTNLDEKSVTREKIASTVFTSTSEPTTHSVTQSSVDLFEQFKRSSVSLIDEALQTFVEAHRLVRYDETTNRAKRSLLHVPYGSINDKRGVFRLKQLVPWLKVCPGSSSTRMLEFKKHLVTVCLVGNELILGEVLNGQWFIRYRQMVIDPRDTAVFVEAGHLYVLVAERGRPVGMPVRGFDFDSRGQLVSMKEHSVDSHYHTALGVWQPSTGGGKSWHLAISLTTASPPGRSQNDHSRWPSGGYRNQTRIYKWQGEYFDLYQTLDTYRVRKLCPYTIHNTDYLVVINEMAGPGLHQVDSEVFKFIPDDRWGEWKSVQKIRTFGAVDCTFFTLGDPQIKKQQEFFLVIANQFARSETTGRPDRNVYSVVYKFSNAKWVPFQCLRTLGVNQVDVYKGRRQHEFVLLLSNLDGLELYQYNGWKFVRSGVQVDRSPASPLGRGIHRLFTNELMDGTAFMTVSNPMRPGHTNTFKLSFTYENPLGMWYNSSLTSCAQVNRGLRAETDLKLQQLDEQFKDVALINEPIQLNGDLVVEGDLHIHDLTTESAVDERNKRDISQALIAELHDLNNALNALAIETKRADDLLKTALFTNGDQVISAPFHFNHLHLHSKRGNSCTIQNLITPSVNGINVRNIDRDVIRIDRDQEIKHVMSFDNLIALQDVSAAFINRIRADQIVTKNGVHNVISPVTFMQEVRANNVTVTGLLNGKIIRPDTVLRYTGDQVIESSIVFAKDLQAENVFVRNVNGMNLDQFVSRIVTTSGGKTVTGKKHFKSLTMIDLNMAPGATINTIDVVDLWNNLFWTYGDQIIKAPMNFTNPQIVGNMESYLVNGQRFPNPDLLFTNRDAVIDSPKIFSSPVTFNKLFVNHSLNRIPVINGELDILSKNKPFQVISGNKIYQSVHLSGNTKVNGLVDGIKLSHFQQLLLKRNSRRNLEGHWTINGDVTFEGPVTVGSGRINNIDLRSLYTNSLKLTDRIIPNGMNFVNEVKFGNLTCNAVNGMKLEQDLLTKRTRQSVRGQMTFLNGLEILSDFQLREINGHNLNDLQDALLRFSKQKVLGPKVIQGDLIVDELVVDKINNVNMNDVVVLSRDQIIYGQKNFTNLHVVGDLTADRLDGVMQVNGISWFDLIKNTMTYSGAQIVAGHKRISSIVVPHRANLNVKKINGISLRQVYDNAVFVDTKQVVRGRKTFKAEVTVDHLHFTGLFDGISDYEMKKNWLMKHGDQALRGDLIVVGNMAVRGNMSLRQGVVNSYSLDKLSQSALKLNEPGFVKGEVAIDTAVVTGGAVHLLGTLNGIDLSSEVIRRNQPGSQRVFGRKTFLKDLIIEKPVSVGGRVDNVEVSELCDKVVRKNGDQVISAPVTVTGNVSMSRMSVGGRVNRVDLNALNRTCLQVNQAAHILDPRNFDTLIIEGHVTLDGLLSGVKIEDLARTYMSISKDQRIDSPVSFNGQVKFTNGLHVLGNLNTHDGLVDGVNLTHLSRTSLMRTGHQEIRSHITFLEDVRLNSDLQLTNLSVNGVNLAHLLSSKGGQRISATKTFIQPARVRRSLQMLPGSTLQGVDLAAIVGRMSTARSKRSANLVRAPQHFKSIELDDLYLNGSLNGILFHPNNLLLSDRNQLVRGRVRFAKDLNLMGNVFIAGLINGIDIRKLAAGLVLKGHTNHVTQTKRFVGPLTVRNIEALGRIDGFHIPEAWKLLFQPLDLNATKRQIDFESNKINSLSKYFAEPDTNIYYYKEMFKKNGHSVIASDGIIGSDLILRFERPRQSYCLDAKILSQKSNGLYFEHQIIPTVKPNKILRFVIDKVPHILILNEAGRREQIQRCLNSVLVRAKGQTVSIIQIFQLDSVSGNYVPVRMVSILPATDVALVNKSPEEVCFIFSVLQTESSGSVFCLHRNNWRQMVGALGDYQLNRFQSIDIGHESIISAQDSTRGRLELIRWTHTNNTLSRMQAIFSLNPVTAHLTQTKRGHVYLFLAQGRAGHRLNEPLVRIFELKKSTRTFMEVQRLPDLGEVIQINSILRKANELLIYLLTKDNVIHALEHEKFEQFTMLDEIHAPYANKFAIIRGFDHRLAVSSLSESDNTVTRVLEPVFRK